MDLKSNEGTLHEHPRRGEGPGWYHGIDGDLLHKDWQHNIDGDYRHKKAVYGPDDIYMRYPD